MNQKGNPATKILAMANEEPSAAIGASPEQVALLRERLHP